MKDGQIKKLAIKIANRQCTLFAGAGLTADSGGASWPQLVQELVKKFKYSSPLKDPFHVIEDLCTKKGYDTIYAEIQDRLKDAKVIPPLTKLAAFPWFTAFTTNYDTGLEDALINNQKLAVKTVLRGDEFPLAGLPYELLCVKLMGSVDIPPRQAGSMVIDPGDLALAEVQRSQNLDLLGRHAANLSFLFIGYSFDDGLFIKILEKLNKILGKSPNTHFAVFKTEPPEDKRYLLQQYNVEIIVEDIKTFTEELARMVSLQNPNDFSIKSFRLGADLVPINVTKIGGFLAQYNPVLSETFREYVNPNSFFKGYTESFNPFELGWHFSRDEVDPIVAAVLEKNTAKKEGRLISVVGSPGSGRTFSILASVYNLTVKYRSISIKIPNYALKSIPSSDEFTFFVDEINKAAIVAGVKPPENFIFWTDSPPSESLIIQYLRLSHAIDVKTVLIYEDTKPSQIQFGLLPKHNLITIDMDIDLSTNKKKELTAYLVNTIQQHRLPEANKEEIEKIIAEEKMFLPIMYKALDPARRSINKIVEQDLMTIGTSDTRTFIEICSLTSSLDIDMPVPVMRSALNKITGKYYTLTEVIDFIKQKAGTFVKDYEDSKFNWLLAIYHPIIAKHIARISGQDQMNKILINLADAVDIRDSVEAGFIGALLIGKGVNSYKRMPLPFNQDGLEAALLTLKKRQPARPVLHHLARFYFENNPNDARVIPLLEDALAEPKETYALYEKKGNILTTLAKIKWHQQKETLIKLPRNTPQTQEIMGLLDTARTEENQTAQAYNVHAYDVQARILKDMAHNSANEITKLDLIHEAIDIVTEGLNSYGDDPENGELLNSLLIELLSEVTGHVAEDKAAELLKQGEGIGYYTLATIEYYKNSNEVKANEFLSLSLAAKNYPAAAIFLKIEIMLADEKTPNYKELKELVSLLSARADFRDNWKSLYYKGFICAVNGDFREASRLFHISSRKSPRFLQRRVQKHWIEGGRRRTFQGKVSRPLTEREGRIYSHNVPGCYENIFFDPRTQAEKHIIKPGLSVIFELGFSPRGPIAFDVRPHSNK